MIISMPYQGKTYPLDLNTMTLAEGFTVKAVSGHRPSEWTDELLQIDPGAVLAGLVVAMRRAGRRIEPEGIDRDAVSLDDMATAVLASIEAATAEQKAREAEAEPAPKAKTAGK